MFELLFDVSEPYFEFLSNQRKFGNIKKIFSFNLSSYVGDMMSIPTNYRIIIYSY